MTVIMGYQALLFCPDEKTARTVTQVLTDLDFAVVPCTEPFAAVKKLMGEHFDAVVVDCDNEQNATLLFKSARNAPNNQTALAVAVVEGQVGVAKAFRIGANLVLTKPINVEQAKGTLRVARGLLRKGEAAKPAAAPAAVKPANPVSATQKPAAATSWPSSPAAAVAPSAPIQSPTPRPKAAAAMSAAVGSGAELMDTERAEAASLVAAKSAAKASTPNISSALPSVLDAESGTDKTGIDKTKTDKIKTGSASASQTAVTPPPTMTLTTKSSGGSGFGSASAPAPAREVKPSAPAEEKASSVAEPQTPIEVAPPESSANAPTLTFGGTVGADAQPVASGDSKKTLLAVIIVLLIVAGAYVAWTQMGGKMPWISGVAPQPVTVAAVVPRPAPSIALTAKPAVPLPAAPAPDSTVPASAATTHPASAENSPTPKTASTPSTEDTGSRSGKTEASSDSSKPSASTVTPTKAPAAKAVALPVIKKTAATPAATSSDAPAPSLAGISADNGGTLPNLMGGGTTPTPVLQTMNISQGLTQGLILKKTQPTYPSIALQMRIEGSVDLLATISKTGSITAVKILHGDPQLARAALEAVKQWKYKPYLLNGEPVEIQTQITVNFKLPR